MSLLFEYPGHQNELAQKAKEFKLKSFYKVPKGIGSSKNLQIRKAVLHGENGKIYGARAIVQRALGESATFKQFIYEADEQTKLVPIDLFFGRFQPFHIGHYTTVLKMKNPFIVVVKGKESSEDLNQNPLNYQQQKQLIDHAMAGQKNVRVLSSTDLKTFDGKPISAGFAPSMIMALKRMGFQVKHIYCGEDRVDSYRRQIAAANARTGKQSESGQHVYEHLGLDENDVILVDRLTSASAVRSTIRQNDYKTYQKLMPKPLATTEWFQTLRQWMGT